jgi:hypothetical protein
MEDIMRSGVMNLALVFSVLAMPALAEAGGGEGGGPSGVVSPGAPAASQPRTAAPAGVRLPPRLPGNYGRSTTPLPFVEAEKEPRYALADTGLFLVVYSTRRNGAPDVVAVRRTDGTTFYWGKIIRFEARRGGSFVIELQRDDGQTTIRLFIGRGGNIEILDP